MQRNWIEKLADDLSNWILGVKRIPGGIQFDDDSRLELAHQIQKRIQTVSVKTISSYLTQLAHDRLYNEAETPDGTQRTTLKQALEDTLILLENTKLRFTEAFVFISGIATQESCIRVGNFQLYSGNQGPLFDLLEDKGHLLSPTETSHFQQAGCYVVIKDIEGEQQYAFEQIPILVQPLIDVLNLFLATCQSRRLGYKKIEIGEISLDRLSMIMKSNDGRISFSGSIAGGVVPYRLCNESIEEWNQLGFERLLTWFEENRTQSNTVEGRICRSTHWYSKAINAETCEEQFVDLTTALESLLVSDEAKNPREQHGSISQKLATRLAFLLESETDARLKLAREVKKLYGLRSRIVHSGGSISIEQLDRWNIIVYQAILSFIVSDFRNWDEFLDWIERNTYASEKS